MTAIAAAGQLLRKRSARYNGTLTPISKAVKELYRNGQSEIIQNRDSYSRILQSDGSLQTFNPNEVAFVSGVGVANLDETTTELWWSDDLTQAEWAASAIADYGYLSPDGTLNASKLTIDGTSDRKTQSFTATKSSYTYSACVAEDTATQLNLLIRNATTATNIKSLSPTDIDTGLPMANGFYRHSIYVEESDGYTIGDTLIAYAYVIGADGESCFFWRINMTGGAHLTQPILAENGTALRLKDNTLISTFLEKGVWQDDEKTAVVRAKFSDRGSDGYTGGVNESTGRISFSNGDTVNGKYPTLGPAAVGATIKANGSAIQLSSFIASGIFEYNEITVNNSIQADLGYPNDLSIDFTPSAFWTGDFTADTAAVSALRTAAGDDVSAIPAAELWRGENFMLTIKFKPLRDVTLSGNQERIASYRIDASNRTEVVTQTTGELAISLANGGVLSSATTANTVNTNETNTAVIKIGAVGVSNDSYIQLNGGTKALFTLNAEVLIANFMRMLARTDGFGVIEGIIEDVQYRGVA